MILIEKQSDLDEVCKNLLQEKILYIDTEFHRRNTYYAVLSIIQITSSKQKIIIDARAEIDLYGLKEVLIREGILKVFHSPDQDIEILFKIFNVLPKNIFDTQIAANVCGMSEKMSYRNLCKTMLNVDIDKSFQRANWLKRPLSQELLRYAIRDTEFLVPLHRMLSETLTSRNLWDSYNSKSSKLLDINAYKFTPEKIFSKIKLRDHKVKKSNLIPFISLREECAQILDLPRSYCASDRELVSLSNHLPTNIKSLDKLGLEKKAMFKPKFLTKIFELSLGLKDALERTENILEEENIE